MDIHLNPAIGADWQLRRQQKRVVTPGQNEKYYLGGTLHNGTGKVSYVVVTVKVSALLISLLLQARHLQYSTSFPADNPFLPHFHVTSGDIENWLNLVTF